MLDFPNAPISGDTYSGPDHATWQWDGTKWIAVGGDVEVTAGVASFNSRQGAVSLTTADITGAGGAPLASPSLTGDPRAPTPATSDNDTTLATTAFVHNVAASSVAGVSSWNNRTGQVSMTLVDVTGVGGAPLASPAFTGTPTTTTAVATDNSTRVASTAFVQSQMSAAWRPVVQATTIQSGMNIVGNIGTITNTTSPWMRFLASDAMAMGSAFYDCFNFIHDQNGGTGHRTVLNGVERVHGGTDNGFKVALSGLAIADGGTSQIFGGNLYAQNLSGAVNTAICALECDTDMQVAGVSKTGILVCDVSTSTADGNTISGGLIIGKQNGALGYKTALQFGLDVGSNSSPVQAAGTLIRTAQTWTCDRGIDFRNTTFTTAAIDLGAGQPGASAFDGGTIAWAGGAGGKITNRTATAGPRIEFQNNAVQFWNNTRTTEVMEVQTDVNALALMGIIYPATTAATDLGTTGQRWRTIYLTNNPSVSSDPELKENIEPLPPTLGLVCAIEPIRWQWEGDSGVNWGFSAPNVLAAFENAGQAFAGVDEHSLRTGDLISVLWRAVQELTAQVAELRGR